MLSQRWVVIGCVDGTCLCVLVCIPSVWNWVAIYCPSEISTKRLSPFLWMLPVIEQSINDELHQSVRCSLWKCILCIVKNLFSDLAPTVFFYFALLFVKSAFESFESLFVFLSLTSLPASPFSLTFSSSPSLYNPALCGRQGGRGKGREGLRSMSGLRTQRPAAGWIGVIDQAESICSARLLGLCGWRLFLNYYRRQMLVRRCSLSRLDCFSAAWSPPSLSLPLSHFCFRYLLKFCHSPFFYPSPFLFFSFFLFFFFNLTYSTLLFFIMSFVKCVFSPTGEMFSTL